MIAKQHSIKKSGLNFLLILSFGWILLNNLAITMEQDKTNQPRVVVREDPVQFLHSKVDRVLNELRSNKSQNINQLIKMVNQLIIPSVDFEEMAQKITGKSIWAKAEPEDREAFMNELKQLLIRTYVLTLKNYTEEKIEFQNYSGKLDLPKIQIKSTVMRPNKENLSIDYRLIAYKDSWKVYDLIIEGVSILSGFVAQFSDDIRMNGLKFVINKIKQHNASFNQEREKNR